MELTETQNELVLKGMLLELEQLCEQATNQSLPRIIRDELRQTIKDFKDLTRLIKNGEYYIVPKKR